MRGREEEAHWIHTIYLSIESDSEVGAEISLPSGSDVHHFPECLMQLPIHLHHVLEVPVLLVEGLQQLKHLSHHLIPLCLLQVIDARLKQCYQVALQNRTGKGSISH